MYFSSCTGFFTRQIIVNVFIFYVNDLDQYLSDNNDFVPKGYPSQIRNGWEKGVQTDKQTRQI